MRILRTLQIVLTILAVLAGLVGFGGAMWLHSMAYADPVRRSAEPIFEPISLAAWLMIVFWFWFSVIHGVLIVVRKLTTRPARQKEG